LRAAVIESGAGVGWSRSQLKRNVRRNYLEFSESKNKLKRITFRLAIAILTFLIGVVVAAWCTVRHYGPNNLAQREADCIRSIPRFLIPQSEKGRAQYSIDSMRCLSKSSLLASMKVIDWFGSRHFMLRSPFGFWRSREKQFIVTKQLDVGRVWHGPTCIPGATFAER